LTDRAFSRTLALRDLAEQSTGRRPDMRGKVIAAVAACSAIAACSAVVAPLAVAGEGATKSITITENEWGIHGVPKTIKAGTSLTVTVTNKGGMPHELVLEKGKCAKQCALVIGGKKAEIEGLKPGVTKSATWKIMKPGVYTFTCRVPGHWMAGMRKSFTVT
jgi:uncharacterized cupredoxin-like copper-binding protein